MELGVVHSPHLPVQYSYSSCLTSGHSTTGCDTTDSCCDLTKTSGSLLALIVPCERCCQNGTRVRQRQGFGGLHVESGRPRDDCIKASFLRLSRSDVMRTHGKLVHTNYCTSEVCNTRTLRLTG
jgi:hypothetical protein